MARKNNIKKRQRDLGLNKMRVCGRCKKEIPVYFATCCFCDNDLTNGLATNRLKVPS